MKKETPKNRRTWAVTMYSRSSSADFGMSARAAFIMFRNTPNARATAIEKA